MFYSRKLNYMEMCGLRCHCAAYGNLHIKRKHPDMSEEEKAARRAEMLRVVLQSGTQGVSLEVTNKVLCFFLI